MRREGANEKERGDVPDLVSFSVDLSFLVSQCVLTMEGFRREETEVPC